MPPRTVSERNTLWAPWAATRPSIAPPVTVAEAVVGRFPRATTADFGHWGDGGVHCNVVWPPDAPPSAQELDEVRALVFDLVVDRFDGSYSAEHGIGPHNASQWERRTDPARRRMLAALRQVVDPLGVLGHADLPF